MDATDIRRARQFAIDAHGNQMYGSKPYVYHLDKVAQICKSYGGSPTDIVICYLHDVLEDTTVPYEKIMHNFGNRIAYIVDLLSNRSSKEETFRRIAQNPTAIFVKLCDRIANVAEGGKLEKYKKEYPLFKSILYHKGEYEGMWNKLDSLL